MSVLRIVIGGIVLLAAIGSVFFTFHMFSLAQASAKWPSADGVVFNSTLDTTMTAPGKAKALVEYSFEVDGATISGSRIRFGDMTGSGEPFQQAIVDKYPVGKKVAVYYDPENPQQCVLVPGSGLAAYAYFLIPLTLFGVGGFLLITGLFPPPPMSRRAAQNW